MKSSTIYSFFLGLFVLSVYSCANDNLEEIHPTQAVPCDTTGTITYTNDMVPLFEASCGASDINCHKTGNSDQINLDNYTDATDLAVNGDLLGSVLHDAGYEAMPKNAGKLDDCSIQKITAWINRNEPQ